MSPHWFQMLLALADRDRHGLGIMQDVLERTGGQMRLWPGMLYRNLEQLAAAGLIAEVDATAPPAPGNPRFFHITAAGRRACAAEARRLQSFIDTAKARRLLNRS